MRQFSQWTEVELDREIERLTRRIEQAERSPRASARSAVSYLRQMLRDRRDARARLRRSVELH